MPYCLYVRKSRADADAEARGEGETLTRHITALLELAKRRHLDVTQIHKEIVSGETIASRPVMQQLLTEVESGMWDGVLVMEVERLARGDTMDQGIVSQTFKYSNTKIITPLKDFDPNNEYDQEYFEFGLFMSRREYLTINRRLQRGRIASVKEGKFVGSKASYGYKRVKLEVEKGYTLEIMPYEADVVRMVYELYTKGELQEDGTFRRLGITLIAKRLNDLQIPGPTGNQWTPAAIRDILRNPVYTGKICWNARKETKKVEDGVIKKSRPRSKLENCLVVEGRHKAILSQETFDKAQEILSKIPPRPLHDRAVLKNPLSGIIVCAKCGHAMRRHPANSKTKYESLLCHSLSCDNVSCGLSLVESRILDSLRDWLSAYRLQWETNNNTKTGKTTITLKEKTKKKLQTEYETLNNQLNNTYDLLEQGIYTTEQFLSRTANLSDRIRQNEEARLTLDNDISAEKAIEIGRKQIIPKVEKLLETYYDLPTIQAKNEMLKEVLEKVTYLKEKGGRWNNAKESFELVLYPKLPKTTKELQ